MTPTIITFPSIANPSDLSWSLQRFDARFTSPLVGTFQDIVRPGAFWVADMSWKTLSNDDAAWLTAWAIQMSKGNVRCALPNWAYQIRGSGAGSPQVNGGGQSGLTLATKGWTATSTNVLRAGDMIQIGAGSITFTTAPASSAAIQFTTPSLQTYTIGTGNGSTKTFNLDSAYDSTCGVYINSVLQSTSAYTATMQHQLLMVTADASSDGSGNCTLNIEPALRISPANSNTVLISSPCAYFAFAKPSQSATYTAPRMASIAISLQEDIQI